LHASLWLFCAPRHRSGGEAAWRASVLATGVGKTALRAGRLHAGSYERGEAASAAMSIEATAKPPGVRPRMAASGPANASALLRTKICWSSRSRKIA